MATRLSYTLGIIQNSMNGTWLACGPQMACPARDLWPLCTLAYRPAQTLDG